MLGSSADLTTEWEGGSLSELVSVLQSAAMPVRIGVIAPGTTESNAGEVHLLAGGLADAFAGSLRRDDAMAALQRIEGARFVVETRLPDPESGSLSTPGPNQGSLKARPVAAIMRYCEEYVLTCRVEVWRGQERAVIGYRRGEIVSTSVGGSDGSEQLPEVMAWTDGSYEIVLPPPVLPPTPARKSPIRTDDPIAKGERKRHHTLPMAPDAVSAAVGSSAAGTPSQAGKVTPSASAAQPIERQPLTATQPLGGRAPGPTRPPLQQQARAAGPGVPGAPVTVSRPGTVQPPAGQVGSQPVAAPAKPRVRTPTPALGSMTARPPAEPLAGELTTRGTPPVPAVPLVPAAAARPAAHAAPPALPVVPTPTPFQLAQPARASKQPLASNDLKPASGTIEAKSRHPNHLPPTAPPVEIADQPDVSMKTDPANPALLDSRPSTSRRVRPTRKGLTEHPVKFYILVGLALGAGIVVTYWAYWYLPFFHR